MDFKLAIRSLRKNVGFTALAVVVMALGIGANSAIFTVINSVLLRPLGYKDPDRLVRVGNTWREGRFTSMGQFSEPDFDDLHRESTVFEGLSLFLGGGGGDAVIVGSTAEYAPVVRVGPEFFQALGMEPGIGRLFAADEEAPGGPQVAVVSDAFWKRRFGGERNVLGKTLRAYDKVFTVVGVLPPGVAYPSNADVWVPKAIYEKLPSRSAHNWTVIGRLKPGVSVEQAQVQLTSISNRLEQAYPLSNKAKTFQVMRLQDLMVRNVKSTLYLLLGAVALVLLIACANVANLLLARSAGRTREVAVRSALGASRWQISRQLLLESGIVALAAGAAGLGLASWGVDLLLAVAPPNLPRMTEVHLDAWVLGFTLALSLLVSVVCGLAPAAQASKVDISEALKQGGSRGTTGESGRLRSALVVAEIAISIVLLIGAGLLMRSFAKLSRTDWGFRSEKMLVMQANIPASTMEQSERATRTYAEILRRVQAVPGVLQAAGAMGVPGAYGSNGGYVLEGGPSFAELGVRSPQADFIVATSNYFRTLGIPLRAGRDLAERDQPDTEFVAVVNEALVKQSFPNENPIGRRIQCGLDRPEFMTIVGVVGNIRQADPAAAPRPAIYMPYHQHAAYGRAIRFVIQTQAEPLTMTEVMRKTVAGVSTEIPVKFTTLNAVLGDTVASPRFRSALLSLFAALAVCLAMAGVYGVMAYMVTQRAPEIGLRMALGASRPAIVQIVLQRGLGLAGIGLVLGLAGAFWATRLLETMLYGVQPTDPLTFAVTAALVVVVTALGCAAPAWRAARLDPMKTLRQE